MITKVTDEKLKECPTCGSVVERIVTGRKDFYSPIRRSK